MICECGSSGPLSSGEYLTRITEGVLMCVREVRGTDCSVALHVACCS